MSSAIVRVATRLGTLSDDYETVTNRSRALAMASLRDQAVPFLQQQIHFVKALVATIGSRNGSVSDITHDVMRLTTHVVHTTGAFHDRQVCAFLDGVRYG